MATVALILIRSGYNLAIFGIIFAALSYMRTSRFKRVTGVDPWHIPPVVWAILSFFIALLGTLLSLIACATTNVPGRGRGGGYYGWRGPGAGYPPPGYGPSPGQIPPPGGYATPGYATPGSGPGFGGSGATPGLSPMSGAHPSAYPVAPPPPAAASGPPAWHADPTRRHQHRYWDGTSWTEHVSDNGTAATDPV